MKRTPKVKFGYLCGLLGLFLYSCANIIAPDGGPKDTTPPELLSITPADSQLNIKPKKITARFNKYMEVKDITQQMTITPLINIPPTVIAYGKRIEMELVDSLLRPNTTYKIDFGKAITDNREYTPVENFTYVFSTGSYFDSLHLTGYIIDALTGLPDTSMTVMLYDHQITDSQIALEKPIYVAKANDQGIFQLDILPNLDFKLIAVQDVDNNKQYTAGAEKIAFWHSIVNPSKLHQLDGPMYSFLEEDSAGNAQRQEQSVSNKYKRIANNNNTKKTEPTFKVLVDTNNTANRTYDITENLIIKLPSDSINIDKDKIYLSYDASGIEAEAPIEITQSNDSISIKSSWLEDKIYTLRLIKGWAKDNEQKELLPGKFKFRTKGKQDYSDLTIHFPDSFAQANYIALVKTDTDTIYYNKVEKSIKLPFQKPNTYSIFIFKDEDNNGKWTTGDWKQKRLPELMIPHDGKVILRAGWDNEVDFVPFVFKPQTINQQKAPAPTPITESKEKD